MCLPSVGQQQNIMNNGSNAAYDIDLNTVVLNFYDYSARL
jgi:hypothetical protein